VLQWMAGEALLDRGLKVRSLNLPDRFQAQDSPAGMYREAGLDAETIAAFVDRVFAPSPQEAIHSPAAARLSTAAE